jgi:pimeloyl-ACP methyl ester carboxylesterase
VPHAEVNGQRLYYEVQGDGDPLLLVMGLAGDTVAWALQVGAWSRTHKVVVFDNRDVGQSSYADGPYEIADMATDTLELADHLELDTFHLIGLSMGGLISQEIALRAPERIRTLTLAVTFGGAGRYGQERRRLMGEVAGRLSREEHVDNMLLVTMSEEFFENPESVQWLRNLMLSNPHPQKVEGFQRQVDAAGRHDLRDRLGEIRVPTHVVGAEHDVMTPPWKSTELAELIPDAKLTMLPRAAHMVSIEDAEAFNGAVMGFVNEHSAASPAAT